MCSQTLKSCFWNPRLHHHGSPRRSGDCCRRAHVVPDAIIMVDNTWAAGVLFRRWILALMFPFRPLPNIWWGFRCDDWHCRVQCTLLGAAAGNAYLMGQMVDADTAYITSRACALWVFACVNIMKAV